MRYAAAAMVLLALTPLAAQAPDASPIVHVGVLRVQSDGEVRGYAVETAQREGEAFSTAVWVSNGGCRIGAGPQVPDDVTDAWEARGRIVTMTAEHAIVELEWQRVRSGGGAVHSQPRSSMLTLQLNQPVTLDMPAPADQAACEGSSAPIFGARFAPRGPSGLVARRGGAGGGPLSGSGSAIAGRFGGSGGAQVVRSQAYAAELWLVHSVPGMPDTVTLQRLHAGSTPANFAFAPIQFAVPGGSVRVTVTGSLHLSERGASRQFAFQADRSVAFTPANRPSRDPGDPSRDGRASWTGRIPGPDEVLAFEMPALTVPGGPAVANRFSVRLRLRPASGGQ